MPIKYGFVFSHIIVELSGSSMLPPADGKGNPKGGGGGAPFGAGPEGTEGADGIVGAGTGAPTDAANADAGVNH